MAHGREGPDIVQTTQYVGASGIRAMTDHEKNRTPDGSSAIDPTRTHLNEVLIGPETQQEALDQLYASGVKKPAAQAEAPYIQMVLSASPSFFRTEGKKAGEWDQKKLTEWKEETLKWLKKEYGRDLVHVSLHLDEDTPHLHVLIVPTYNKKPRRPGKPKKGETPEAFEARKEAAENGAVIRTVGRASNEYWSRNFVRRIARQSYHAAMEPIGLGYGRDFVGEGDPSPERKETGTWLREQAAKLKEDRAELDAEKHQLQNDMQHLDESWKKLELKRDKLIDDREKLNQEKKELSQIRDAVADLLSVVRKSMKLSDGSRSGIVKSLQQMLELVKPAQKLKPEKASTPEGPKNSLNQSGPRF